MFHDSGRPSIHGTPDLHTLITHCNEKKLRSYTPLLIALLLWRAIKETHQKCDSYFVQELRTHAIYVVLDHVTRITNSAKAANCHHLLLYICTYICTGTYTECAFGLSLWQRAQCQCSVTEKLCARKLQNLIEDGNLTADKQIEI